MIIFVIIGLISNLENLVLWMFHSCVSRKVRVKKFFRIRVYLRVVWQIIKGTFIALIFCTFLLFSITLIMNAKIFSQRLYSTSSTSSSTDTTTTSSSTSTSSSSSSTSVAPVFWDYLNNVYINDYQSDLAITYRSGRMGLSFLVVGAVITFYTSRFFIGC